MRATAERIVEAPDGRIVVLARQMGTAEVGGAPFDAPLAGIALIQSGLVESLTFHPTHAAALKAAGLSE